MNLLRKELIGLTCPNQKERARIMSLTEKQLKYEIAKKRDIRANWDDEGDVLTGRVNVIDA